MKSLQHAHTTASFLAIIFVQYYTTNQSEEFYLTTLGNKGKFLTITTLEVVTYDPKLLLRLGTEHIFLHQRDSQSACDKNNKQSIMLIIGPPQRECIKHLFVGYLDFPFN